MPEKPSFEKIEITEDKEKEKEEQLKGFLESLRPLATVFSGYGIYEVRIDPKAPSFAFDHHKKEIIASLNLVEKLNLSSEEEKYVFLHENGHLIQLLSDPQTYLESFEIPKEKAKEEKKYKEAVEKAWHNFFNTFFDIHDNSIIRNLMPIYQKGGRLENLPKEFYAKKAFAKTNYSKKPLSTQFLDYLLRKIMVPDEEVKISEEVKKEIEQEIKFFGKKYNSLEDFVRQRFFNPALPLKNLIYLLKERLMPVYEKLLEKDKKSGKMKEIPDFIGDFPMDGDISEEDIKKIVEGIKESKKSGDEKLRDNLKKQFEDWAKGKGFSEGEIKRIEEIEKRTFKVRSGLKELWQNFIQISRELSLEKIEGFKRGATVSPQKLISELPILLTRPSEAEIFARYVPEIEKEAIKPKKINLELILDLSGSMHQEKRKIEAVQEVGYALGKSLIDFYDRGCLSVADQGREFPVTINYRILGFGDEVKELTKTTEIEKRERVKKHRPGKNLDEEILRAIMKVEQINLGGTADAKALKIVKESITPEIKEKLENGEEILVVLEITDGETATENESKALVKELNSIGNVYCRGIQILGGVYQEKPEERIKPPEILPPSGTFKSVWTEKWGKELRNLEVLKETVFAILEDALKNYAQQ